MSPLHMNLNPNGKEGKWLLEISGSLEAGNLHLMLESDTIISKMVQDQAKELIADLTETKRVDSLGLQFIVQLYRDLSAKYIHLIVRNPNKHIYRLLQIMRLTDILTVEFTNKPPNH